MSTQLVLPTWPSAKNSSQQSEKICQAIWGFPWEYPNIWLVSEKPIEIGWWLGYPYVRKPPLGFQGFHRDFNRFHPSVKIIFLWPEDFGFGRVTRWESYPSPIPIISWSRCKIITDPDWCSAKILKTFREGDRPEWTLLRLTPTMVDFWQGRSFFSLNCGDVAEHHGHHGSARLRLLQVKFLVASDGYAGYPVDPHSYSKNCKVHGIWKYRDTKIWKPNMSFSFFRETHLFCFRCLDSARSSIQQNDARNDGNGSSPV